MFQTVQEVTIPSTLIESYYILQTISCWKQDCLFQFTCFLKCGVEQQDHKKYKINNPKVGVLWTIKDEEMFLNEWEQGAARAVIDLHSKIEILFSTLYFNAPAFKENKEVLSKVHCTIILLLLDLKKYS